MILLFILALDTLHLDLDQTIKVGLRRSLVIKESGQSINQSRLGLYDALSDLLPTPSSYYEISHTEGLFDTTSYNWNLYLNQTIFNTSLIYSILAGFDQVSLSKVELREKTSSTVYDITETYINLIIGFASQKNLKSAGKRAVENQRLARARYNLGLTSKLDLLQAEIATINTSKDLIDNENRIDQFEEHLRNLLDTNCYIIPIDSLSQPETRIDPSEIKKDLITDNPSIRSARINRAMASKDLIFSYLAILPRVSAYLSYTYRSYDSPNSIREIWDDKFRSYGLRIDFPIFNIKDILLGVMKARVKKKQAAISLRIASQQQEENLSSAIRTIRSSLLEIGMNKKGLEAAKEALRLARERYRNGKGSLLSLLTAQSDLQKGEANFLTALGDYHLAMARIVYLIGKGGE